MQGDQSRGFLAKAVTVPAVIIDSQEALIYLFFIYFFYGDFFKRLWRMFLSLVVTEGSGSVSPATRAVCN